MQQRGDMTFNFTIMEGKGPVSDSFLAEGITDFQQAAHFIRRLPYRRNSDKTNPLILFREACGTCSTKHATLLLLAVEQGCKKVVLCMSIFRMNGNNTPLVRPVLDRYQLPFMPEAHNYLRISGTILDCTGTHTSANDFEPELMEEFVIEPDQIGVFKVQYHKAFIQKWREQASLSYSPEALWEIREACIAALSG